MEIFKKKGSLLEGRLISLLWMMVCACITPSLSAQPSVSSTSGPALDRTYVIKPIRGHSFTRPGPPRMLGLGEQSYRFSHSLEKVLYYLPEESLVRKFFDLHKKALGESASIELLMLSKTRARLSFRSEDGTRLVFLKIKRRDLPEAKQLISLLKKKPEFTVQVYQQQPLPKSSS